MTRTCSPRRPTAVLTGALALTLVVPVAASAAPQHRGPHRPGPGPVVERMPKTPAMVGSGGAVASVDAVASQVGLDVLARGGNAADAAVATAAALGVVEPFANGIGGGGFFVYYDARAKKVSTIDGRETAPRSMTTTSFLEGGKPMSFDKAVASGLSVGVPGTPATWQAALDSWGTRRWSELLAPAQEIATRGFVVDKAFEDQVTSEADKLAMFPAAARIFLPGGQPIKAGSVLRNQDLARTYAQLRRQGPSAFYHGPVADAIVKTVNHPQTAPGVTVPAGGMTTRDLADYRVNRPAPIHSEYEGHDYYGMAGSSSGGIAVAETLNLLEAYARRTGVPLSQVDDVQYFHRFAEATATAFADRNRWVGDVPGVPRDQLVSQAFADERACGFDPAKAQARPIASGSPDGSYSPCGPIAAGKKGTLNDGQATTHLVVADKWGNVASYTLTIEQWAGSGMVVPGYGFLLNNELTDFNFAPMTPGVPDPNLPAPGKRPRSSMSPSILLKDGRPVLAAGAAGGATIITTTAQTITQVLDRGRTASAALGTPRLSSRNTKAEAEPALLDSATGAALKALGQPMVANPVLGRGTAIRILGRGLFDAGAEPTRGGGGSAMVVRPGWPRGHRR